MSISNTRLRSRAQLIGAGAARGGTSASSAEKVFTLTGTFGMISGRSNLALGASTPWKRMRCNRGPGTKPCSLVGGGLRHAPGAAGGTKSTPLAGKGHELFMGAVGATQAQKAVG